MTLELMDVTIRDGSYAINYTYKPEQVGQIASSLEKAGVNYIEVSHGCGLGAKRLGMPAFATDVEYTKAAKENTNSKIKVGVIAGPTSIPSDISEVSDYIDFIRFAANVGEVDDIKDIIEYAKNNYPHLEIFLQMVRCSRKSPNIAANSAKYAKKIGVDVVYVVDTNAHMIPEDVKAYILAIKNIDPDLKIGFHGHDNLRLAVANSIVAATYGANIIDSSLRGMGRSSGNASLEILAYILKRKGLIKDIDLNMLIETSDKFIKPIMPTERGINSTDFRTAMANIDLYPLSIYELVAKEAKIELSTLITELSKQPIVEVGGDDIRNVLSSLGLNVDKIMNNIKKKLQ